MISWSRKRQIIYFLSVVGFLILISAYPLFSLLYEPPTCIDGKQNQDELGVDCGGSCDLLCNFQVTELSVLWSDAFHVEGDVYDLVAFIENKNPDAGITYLYYTIKAYDRFGEVSLERKGVTYANALEEFVLFEPDAKFPEKPARVDVEFNELKWQRTIPNREQVTVKDKRLIDHDISPKLIATLENNSPDVKRDIEAIALVYDELGKVVAVSSTYLNTLGKNTKEEVFFTWPNPISVKGKIGVCTAPVDAMLIIDRSGSMDDDNVNPPQPLTDAKNAAEIFVDNMRPNDQVGVVSFATFASIPIDQELSLDHVMVKRSIDRIAIHEKGTQHTNLGDAIEKAAKELISSRGRSDTRKAIVLLTDGIASRPVNPEDANDEEYPERYAKERALAAREKNILLYVIGLGESVNGEFLRDQIAYNKDKYYQALTSGELDGIYNEIAQVVCAEEIFTTEIKVRANDSSTLR